MRGAGDDLESALFGISHRDRAIGPGLKSSNLEFRQELWIRGQQGSQATRNVLKDHLSFLSQSAYTCFFGHSLNTTVSLN